MQKARSTRRSAKRNGRRPPPTAVPREAARRAGGAAAVIWWISQAAGAILLVYAARLWLHALRAPLSVYDEGIVLTHSFMVRNGYWPHRDFYANYPPGTWLTVNAVWSLLGMTVPSARALGAVVHLALIGCAGRLVGHAAGRGLALLPMGVCAVWLAKIAPVPYAWVHSLAAALLAIALVGIAAERRRAQWWVLSGLAVAAIGFFRHDLLVRFALCAAVGLGLWAFLQRAHLARAHVASIAVPFTGALVAACLAFWVPVIWVGGLRQVTDDLYFDMVRYMAPCRALPLPRLTSWDAGAPVVLSSPFEHSVALVFLGPLIGTAALGLGWRDATTSARLLTLLLTALSAAVIPQMTGRADMLHSLYGITPALLLLFVLAFRPRPWPARGLALACVTLLVMWPVRRDLQNAFRPLPEYTAVDPRLANIPFDPVRWEMVADLQRRTQPDERIYVGMVTHRFTIASEMDVYFLAARAGGVRRMQFDPCLSNQEKGQRETIAELERNRVRVAVLSHNFAFTREANDNWRDGADLLDEHVRAHFAPVATFGPYEMWERRSPEGGRDAVEPSR